MKRTGANTSLHVRHPHATPLSSATLGKLFSWCLFIYMCVSDTKSINLEPV